MEDLVEIQTKLGKLRGRAKNSLFSGRKYYAFLGIPYGKPPIGDLRFKAPQPIPDWEGVRDALEDGNDCKQSVFFRKPDMDPNQVTQGDEDCLYLCVYTNELPEQTQTKKPVMVNIHGGGFAGGSGNSKSAGPDYFLEGDVVFVSLNYRCGALGFLSLENDDVPGNAGLKDQTLALKWVRDNIDSFGGDPNNVTIFGISAGGASVHYHLLSPLSKGLFHKAIIQSGYAQNPWAFQHSPKRFAIKLAKKLGCKSEDPHQVLKFLQSVKSDNIVIATREISKEKDLMMCCGLVFSPCVEVAGSERFLPDTPNKLMKKGEYNKVPTILGLCQNEGTVALLFAIVNGISFEETHVTLNSNPELLVPSFLGLKSESPEEKQVQKAILDFYFKGSPISFSKFSQYMEYQSDVLFNIGFGETRRYLLANSFSPVYSYLFTNHTKCMCSTILAMLSPHNPASKFMPSAGTCHGADMNFMFTLSNGMTTPELTSDFKAAISRHIGAWTTFALTGDPNSEELGERWERDSQLKGTHMDIGTMWELKQGVAYADRMDFWEQITAEYCLMEDNTMIQTRLGKLRGRIRQSAFSNKTYYAFQGIPFAKPPVGDLRFKAPQPFGSWEGVRDALEDGPMCVQPLLSTPNANKFNGNEDCLYLNVYVNEHPEKIAAKRPVLVSIHGGGFMCGSGNFNQNDPEYLVEADVVLVFFNYRCGPFGFLSLETEDVPGNAGLKDQTLALRWVQDNIDSFGGDPNNVTIFGISAGGASVHYNILSPLSKGLFQKAIIQSGYGQNLWAFQPSAKKVSMKLAQRLGCESDDSGEVLKFLQSVSKDDIMRVYNQMVKEKDYIMSCTFVFLPCVEVAGSDKFLPDTPENLMRRGEYNKVPTIMGVCQNEGTLQQMSLSASGLKEEELCSIVNGNPEILVPHFLGLEPGSPEENEAKDAIWNFYFKGKRLTLDNFHEYVNLHSDLQFNLGYAETRRHLLTNSGCQTYSYLFTNHTNCICKAFKLAMTENDHDYFKRDEETCHGGDCFYYYASVCGISAPKLTGESKEAILKHVNVWSKFALSGNPNMEELGVTWDRDSETRPCYMDIGTAWTMREGVPFAERMNFWHQLTDKYS